MVETGILEDQEAKTTMCNVLLLTKSIAKIINTILFFTKKVLLFSCITVSKIYMFCEDQTACT